MSLWWTLVDRPTFPANDIAQKWDVVILGGGFSGLWTAHHLISAQPQLKIAILEKNRVGSGASGRNGGWVSSLYPISDRKLQRRTSPTKIEELHSHLRASIDEIGNFVKEEKIDCGYIKGGSLTIARNGGQLERIKTGGGSSPISRDDTVSQINMNGALGSEYTEHCASINPAALVVGIAQSLVNAGVSIFEYTPARIVKNAKVYVDNRELNTSFVVRAIEAYHDRTRDQIPIYSLMIASNPLPSTVFDEIGIQSHQTFAEASHLITYAQRTSDNRLVIGGRGAPYSWGSKRNDSMENRKRDHQRLRELASKWFPIMKDFDFPYAWGGAVAVTRDWAPYLRTRNSYGEMGGYVGDGVTLSYLVAAAMADIIGGRDTPRTQLPFVQWRNPLWEPEPLRWLAINGAIKIASLADREESLTNKPSMLMKLASPFLGH